jgi:hypothetical protein
MINDLTTPTTTSCESLWKYVDDTTLSETISKKYKSSIQESVDAIQAWAISNMAELNEEKHPPPPPPPPLTSDGFVLCVTLPAAITEFKV